MQLNQYTQSDMHIESIVGVCNINFTTVITLEVMAEKNYKSQALFSAKNAFSDSAEAVKL